MPASIIWKIDEMQRQPSDGLVTKVFWRVEAVEDEFRAAYYGATHLDRSEAFIPYENLTEEVVVEWIKHSIDLAAVERQILENIENQKNPPLIVGLPWNT